jgi:hypothetical protein
MLLRRKSYLEMFDQLTKFAVSQLGFGPVGDVQLLHDGSSASYLYFRDKIYDASMGSNIWLAENKMVTKRNDVILVTPDSHAWKGEAGATATALLWDKDNCHMLGLDPSDKAGYNRARFSHSGYAMANFMTVSGAANCFKNLRWMHGSATGGAADLTCLTVSGDGNRFENCGFAGPNDATQAATAGYRGVVVSGSQNHFKNCMFGSINDIDRSAANALLQFTTGCGAWNVFENCVFRSRSGGGENTPIFIDDATTDTVVDFTAIFLNCQFLHSGTALTYAVTKANNASRHLFFDNRCTFANVADIVNATEQAQILCGAATYTAAATSNLLASALTT